MESVRISVGTPYVFTILPTAGEHHMSSSEHELEVRRHKQEAIKTLLRKKKEALMKSSGHKLKAGHIPQPNSLSAERCVSEPEELLAHDLRPRDWRFLRNCKGFWVSGLGFLESVRISVRSPYVPTVFAYRRGPHYVLTVLSTVGDHPMPTWHCIL